MTTALHPHASAARVAPALRALLATTDAAGPAAARVGLGLLLFPHGAQHALGWFGGHSARLQVVLAPSKQLRVMAYSPRLAAARAARRRGSSITIRPPLSQPQFSSASGTRVVLPAPGGATRTVEVFSLRAACKAGRISSTGSMKGVYPRAGAAPSLAA